MKAHTYSILVLLLVSSCFGEVTLDNQFWSDLTMGVYRIGTAFYEDMVTPSLPLTDDAYKSDGELYQSFGYRFEEHKVMTEDGYILTAWRVPGKITDSMKDMKDKPVAMLQHGLLDNSATWTINEFNNTLPYLLLQEGYDVWITNTRGNFNSYEHSNPRDFSVFNGKSSYWNFTLDGMALYDLPANIDYILDYTNNKKLTYIGHSQGTIQFFAANCVKSLADKIERFVGLGPVMFVNHVESPLVKIIISLHIDQIANWFGLNNLLLWPKILNVQLKDVVKPIKRTVWRIIQMICGVGQEFNIDLERMPVMGRHEPGGTGMMNMMHWIQFMKTGVFKRFDFGEEENIRVYGQSTAPLYDLDFMNENLKDLEMFLVKGGSDSLVSQPDFDHLLDVLKDKTPETLEHIIVPKYGHLDYVWAKDSLETVNKPVIEFLKKKRALR